MIGPSFSENQRGFSLIEILVALALVAVTFAIVPMISADDQGKLEEAIENIDRAVKTASNEAILRNTVTRVYFYFADSADDEDAGGFQYSVQFGPSGGILQSEPQDLSKMGLSDKEALEKQKSQFDSKFNNIDDDNFVKKSLPERINFWGIASSTQKEIQTENNFAVYFYPTGERDEALIFLASSTELASLEVEGFSETTRINYYPLSERELENRQDSLDNKREEVYSKWIKQ